MSGFLSSFFGNDLKFQVSAEILHLSTLFLNISTAASIRS